MINRIFVISNNIIALMKRSVYLYSICCLILFSCNSNHFKTIRLNDTSAWNKKGNVICGEDELILSDRNSTAVTTSAYKNFILELEVKTEEGAIGAIHFHADGFGTNTDGYEVLINNNSEPDEWRKTGSLSTIRNFGKCVAWNNEWTPIRIEVVDKNIKVYVKDLFIVDYTEPSYPYRTEENKKRILDYGIFMLCNYSDSPIAFRNMKVKPLDKDLFNRVNAQDEQNDDIIRLSQINFPTIDEHLHLKGGLTKEDVAELTRKYGITYGLSPNCGKKFPIQNDEQIYQWLDTMQNTLCFLAGQAEGREWLEMFSLDAISEFDYMFTDALTWTDHKGRRMRLWIPEETFVDDKQQFMDMLVERACEIITTEPVDIYVNPTFLPQELNPEYDQLWTKERMDKVIEACINRKIAIEIGCRYRIPSQKFIQRAKDKGAKFTIGTNNEGIHDVGKLEYAVEMINACNLTADDMWIPTSKNR